MIKPKRLFIVRIDDPCSSLETSSHILLYTLMVSHGIRVDTGLYIIAKEHTYFFNGLKLRHLYPQESSLKGFSKAVFCKHHRLPGVYFNRDLFVKGSCCVFIESSSGLGLRDKPPCTSVDYLVIPLDTLDVLERMIENIVCRVYVRVSRDKGLLYRINAINYLLDTWYGAWVRRKGVVKRYGGLWRSTRYSV